MVESGLAARGQHQYLRPHLWDGGGSLLFDLVSVSHVGDALRSIAAFNASNLALSGGQRESSNGLPFSLNRCPLTDSLANDTTRSVA